MAHQVEVAQDSHPTSLDKQCCTGTWKETSGGGLFDAPETTGCRAPGQSPEAGCPPRGHCCSAVRAGGTGAGRRKAAADSDKAGKDRLTQVPLCSLGVWKC